MNKLTKETIERFSPMWTNKQVWEFEQLDNNLTFDMSYVDPNDNDIKLWDSKNVHLDSEIRDIVISTFDYLSNGYELWIANKKQKKLDDKHIPYIMAVMTDIMIDEEICLNFRITDGYLIISIDSKADIIDCKEFFEEFYHLATGFNYNIDTGIPEDETEAEIYLTRLQEDFDERMKIKLGDVYLNGNNDPDTINSQ